MKRTRLTEWMARVPASNPLPFWSQEAGNAMTAAQRRMVTLTPLQPLAMRIPKWVTGFSMRSAKATARPPQRRMRTAESQTMPRENLSTAGWVNGVNRSMKPARRQTQNRIRKRYMRAGVGPGLGIQDLCYFLIIRGAASHLGWGGGTACPKIGRAHV